MLRKISLTVLTTAVTLGILVPVVVYSAMSRPPEMPKFGPNDKAGDKFKNIKVLKDLPANDLIPTMRVFARSLGVKCTFCHVIHPDHTGFDLDTKKPKLTARKMIVMVQDLNKNVAVLQNKATCYMCHRGQKKPVTQLPPAPNREMGPGPGGPPAAPPASQPTEPSDGSSGENQQQASPPLTQ